MSADSGRYAVVFGLVMGLFVGRAALAGPTTQSAAAGPTSQPSGYFTINIHGAIGRDFGAMHMAAALKQVATVKPAVVVLVVDSPGGSVRDADEIIKQLIETRNVRFVALVRRALSAAAAITLCCDEIYVTEVATIGAAVSFSSDGSGGIIELPPDVAEKMQSAWRATCRSAAEHGKHDGLLAEAMVDKDFALTMKLADGKPVLVDGQPVFERDGKGKLIKARGRILTLTARDALGCMLAKGIVTDLSALGQALNMANWVDCTTNVTVAASSVSGTVETDPAKLAALLQEKAKALNLTDFTLTKLGRKKAVADWDAWVEQQKFKTRQVKWGLMMADVKQIDATVLAAMKSELDMLQADVRDAKANVAAGRVRGGTVDQPMNPVDLRELIRKMDADLAERTRVYQELLKCPILFKAHSPMAPDMWVDGMVRKEAEAQMSAIRKGQDFTITGTLSTVAPAAMPDGRLIFQVVLERCTLGSDTASTPPATVTPVTPAVPTAPTTPTAPATSTPTVTTPPAPAESNEDRARARLNLAETYASGGLKDQAREILTKLIAAYPTTKAAAEAKDKLAAMK